MKALVGRPCEFYACFISYNHTDKSFARRLHDQLQRRGIRYWLDEHQLLAAGHLLPGDLYPGARHAGHHWRGDAGARERPGPPFARGRFFAIWRPVAQLGATVTPAIFAGIAQHAGYGYGFLYRAGCALIVALGVGTVLGDTLAQHDREEMAREAGRAG